MVSLTENILMRLGSVESAVIKNTAKLEHIENSIHGLERTLDARLSLIEDKLDVLIKT